MAHTFSLGFYAINAHEKRHKDKLIQLQDDGLFQHISDYLNSIPSFNHGTAKQTVKPSDANKNDDTRKVNPKLIFIDKSEYKEVKNKRINGRLRGGDGGFSSKIVDGETGKMLLNREIKDVEIIPYYFEIDFPKSGTPLIAIQRSGVHGIASQINEGLQRHLALKYPDLTVKISPIFVGGLYIDKYMTNGQIKEVEVISHKKPKDRASPQLDGIRKTETITFSPEKKRDGYFSTALNKLFKKDINELGSGAIIKNVLEYLQLNISTEEFKELKVKVKLNNVTRTVDIGDISRFATHYDITEDVDKAEDGHPILSSIDTLTAKIIKEEIRTLIK